MESNDIAEIINSLELPVKEDCVLAPFESPIEAELHRELSKYVHSDTIISNQDEYRTPNGNYRGDFQLARGDHKIVLEANGKEYHDTLTDLYRGSFIIGFSDVRSIYYIRGCDITYSLPTVLHAIAVHEPYLFSERGAILLNALTDVKDTRGHTYYTDRICIQQGVLDDAASQERHPVAYRLMMLRKHGDDDMWKRVYNAALENPGIGASDFDECFIRSPHYNKKYG